MGAWQKLDSKIAYKNKWYQIREDSVITPPGDQGIYGVLELANDVIYIVGVAEDGSMYLSEQFRYPLQQTTWEFPAGQTDGEDPEVAASRELLEETGQSANSITKVGHIAVDTGFSSSMVHIFVAKNLTKQSDELDSVDGILQTKTFQPEEIKSMIMNGEIICPHTIAAFYIASEYLKG